jgi:uncharacterized protein YfbU (UPF0304 family)
VTLSKSNEYLYEVQDVLIMFRALGPAAQFQGFDRRTEAKHMSYARSLIENVTPWRKLKPDDYDSRCEMMPAYRRMLSKWRTAADGHKLTREEAASIIAAAPRGMRIILTGLARRSDI